MDTYETGSTTRKTPYLDPFRDDSNTLIDEHVETKSENNPLCSTLLEHSRGNALVVTAANTVDGVMTQWQAHHPNPHARLGIISIGDSLRSTAAATPTAGSLGQASFTVIPSPLALDDLGHAIQHHLTALHAGPPLTVCFDALDELLEHTNDVRVLRFLAGVMTHCQTATATAHYHIIPAHHSTETIRHVEAMFGREHPRP